MKIDNSLITHENSSQFSREDTKLHERAHDSDANSNAVLKFSSSMQEVQPTSEPLYCPKCAAEVNDPLTCGDCGAVICRRCGTPLESPDELGIG
jgi:hypothetical protein